jgi:hypothetical protein
MQNEIITIEIHRDETGKIKVNVLTDGMQMSDLLMALDKAHGAVMSDFEAACINFKVATHHDRKALLQRLNFNNAKAS